MHALHATLHKHLLTHRRNIKNIVLSTEVVIRQITQDHRPDIASVSGCCPQWLKTLTTNVTRLKHLRSQQKRNGKGNKEYRLLALLATYKNLACRRENQNTPLRWPDRRTCSLDTQICAPQNRCNGMLCQKKKDVQGSVSSRSLFCRCNDNSFPRVHTMYLQIDFVSHWTRHDIVFHGMRFSAHRQLMSCLTSAAFANDW